MIQQPRRPRILAAQSDPVLQELLVTRLTLAGYDVITARSGRQALEAVMASRLDGVVLDLGLTAPDGMAVLRSMKQTRAVERMAVLVLGENRSIEDVQLVLKLGARAYLTRPFDSTVFLARLAKMLNRQRDPKPATQPAGNPDMLLL